MSEAGGEEEESTTKETKAKGETGEGQGETCPIGVHPVLQRGEV